MDPLTFWLNGHRPEEFGLYLYDLPTIGTTSEGYESTDVPGKKGSLITPSGTVPSITIQLPLAILSRKLLADMRMIRSWLSADNNVGGILVLSETQDSFYEVQWLMRGELSRDLRRFGRFTATAICYPYEFERTGLEELETTEDKLFNPFEECLPEYRISGEGMCTLTVNGATMSANVGQNLTIDVRRMCAYRNDGSLMNTSVTGDYDELHLMPGENTVTITSGFELKVVPHWGWKA